MDIYGSSVSLELVIYLIKEVNKTVSDNKIFQQELKELINTLEVETETAIDSIIVVNIETLLDTASIALQDKRESVYSKLSK